MEDAKTIMRMGVDRWNAHDRKGFLELFDEAGRFVDEATGHELIGREEIGMGFFDLWTEAFPDNELKDVRVFGEGDLICCEGRFIGTNTGIFRGIDGDLPPTGKKIDAPFIYVAEFRGEKVTVARHYYDRLLALEQEGILTVEKLFAQLPAI